MQDWVGSPLNPQMPSPGEESRLDLSANQLHRLVPEMSALHTLSTQQLVVLLALAAALALGFAINPLSAALALNALLTLIYIAILAYNLIWFKKSLERPAVISVSDEEARSIPDEYLPTYTVLVAAYHEAEVISDTIAAVQSLDYPPSRLEIKLLLESDDAATVAAAFSAQPGPTIEIVLVPPGKPRTKPKACNYGLLGSSGELVTIFDVEDRPEPLQLRRAAAAFRRLDPSIACLQAKLYYHNAGQNLITRWFSAEYATWFASMLPALVGLKAPIPLGGTSMHIRRWCLDTVGGWDANNVTEDADLGVRLHRFGFRTLVLDSVTLEEANSDFINWVKQRSRWYKGYLQTWLVHMRNPRRLWRDLGPAGFVGFQFVVGATPILSLVNPVFWILTLMWVLGHSDIVKLLYPPWLYYPAIASLVLGNFLVVYRTAIGIRSTAHTGLIGAVCFLPAYWLMMALAAVKAFGQLLMAPRYWEKTAHGLGSQPSEGIGHAAD
jgi:cellulose synthase/poly-beta-1,6-N-acetylglucosamine synthase-like glycosyltransferase